MSSCASAASKFDLLGERYQMKFDGDKKVIRTACGACCTVLLLVLIAIFAVQKFLFLVLKNEVTVFTAESKLHFADSEPFVYADGLNVAVGLTSYDGNAEWQLDPSYGELVVNSIEWGQNEDGSYYRSVRPVEARNCTEVELGLVKERKFGPKIDGESRFYSPTEASGKFVQLYKKKLLCLNEEDLIISGSFGNGRAR